MTAVSLDHFRETLQRLLRRAQENKVQWFQDDDEDTLCVEVEPGTLISFYFRASPKVADLVGAILRIDYKIIATLEAEENGADWALLCSLYEHANTSVEDDEDPVKRLDKTLDGVDTVGMPDDKNDPVQFDPMQPHPASREDLTDGDSGFSAEKAG